MLEIVCLVRRWQATDLWRNRKLCKTVRHIDSNRHSLRIFASTRDAYSINFNEIDSRPFDTLYIRINTHSVTNTCCALEIVNYSRLSRCARISASICFSCCGYCCYRRTFNRMIAIRWVSSVACMPLLACSAYSHSHLLRFAWVSSHVSTMCAWKPISAATLP